MNKEKELYSSNLSLKQLLREVEDFCYEHGLDYDKRKIMVTTDYGSNVVILYKEENENNLGRLERN
jgi:mevalonate pyrophosphate decarboxylase